MAVKKQPPEKIRISIIAWIFLIALLAWNIWNLWPRPKAQVALPYSVFRSEVSADNVTEVTIAGDQIQGDFKNPVVWDGKTATVLTIQDSAASHGSDLTFQTNFPEVVGDISLMSLLSQHDVQVVVAPSPSPWFAIPLADGLPLVLLFLVLIWIGGQAVRSQASVFNFGRSRASQTEPDRPELTFEGVAGADEAKENLREVVDFLRQPEKYEQLGTRIPRGVLLVGPTGAGKTLLARAAAGEAGVPFFNLSAANLVEKFINNGTSRVRDLFDQAKAASPAIVFIDDLDVIGRWRGAVNDERERILKQLLDEMDSLDERQGMILLATANDLDELDPALLKPGRFERVVTIGLPDRSGRQEILKIHTRFMHLSADVDLGLLARTTAGFSGVDLKNLCNEAALAADRNNREKVEMGDFEEALDRILLGANRSWLVNENERRTVAYHEAGHALVAWLTPGAVSFHKLTLMPHGHMPGVIVQPPEGDRYHYSQPDLLARLAVMLGGRAAEQVGVGEISTAAENDLIEATRLARQMVTRWGMGSLGLMAFAAEEEHLSSGYELAQGRDYSDATAARVDQDVQRLLAEGYEKDLQLLKSTRDKLDALVRALLLDETIDQSVMIRILGARETAANFPVETSGALPAPD